MPRIGLISDTHDLLRPQALAALHGYDQLIHAGDIGQRGVLETLSARAPLIAVRGNNDTDPWTDDLPETANLRVAEISIYVLHDLKQLRIDPRAAGFQVVISGHSHRPAIEQRDGVLYVNPGSAGPRRFNLPVSIAELRVAGAAVSARIIELQIDAAAAVRKRRTREMSAAQSKAAHR